MLDTVANALRAPTPRPAILFDKLTGLNEAAHPSRLRAEEGGKLRLNAQL
jgi:hypothetical protein